MLNLVLTVISLAITIIILTQAWNFFHNEPPWLEERIEGLLSTFFEPDENGQNMVDQIGARLGASIKGSFMGQKSGEVRHEKMLEKRVFTAAVENVPELKIGLAALDKLGLGDIATPENAPALLSLANKYGLLGFLKGNNPGSSSEGVM